MRKRNAITIRFNEHDPAQAELMKVLSQTSVREVRGYLLGTIYEKSKLIEPIKDLSVLDNRLLTIIEKFAETGKPIAPTLAIPKQIKPEQIESKVSEIDFTYEKPVNTEIDYDKLLDSEIDRGIK